MNRLNQALKLSNTTQRELSRASGINHNRINRLCLYPNEILPNKITYQELNQINEALQILDRAHRVNLHWYSIDTQNDPSYRDPNRW
jgi:hypothetical protein